MTLTKMGVKYIVRNVTIFANLDLPVSAFRPEEEGPTARLQ
jgi:hypothetical protein